jgi:hypothetical protein
MLASIEQDNLYVETVAFLGDYPSNRRYKNTIKSRWKSPVTSSVI